MELRAIQIYEVDPLIKKIEELEARLAAVETKEPPNELMSEKEAFEYLRISKSTLYELRRTGKITYIYHNTKTMFRRAELDAYLERNTVRPRRLRQAI